MSQAEIDAFVESARNYRLTPEGVTTAVVTRGISVCGRHSSDGWTALHFAVYFKRRQLVVALLAAGADANVKDDAGRTSVWWGAYNSTADILQLLIDGGGSVNEADNVGRTPLIVLVLSNLLSNLLSNYGAAVAARLQVLLACSHLDLDTEYAGKTAEEWAVTEGNTQLTVAIAEERERRERWSALRAAWIAAITPTATIL